MSERLYRIKPLEWTTTFGSAWADVCNSRYCVYRSGTEWRWRLTSTQQLELCDSLEAGKAACEAHWRSRLEAVLEPVEVKP